MKLHTAPVAVDIDGVLLDAISSAQIWLAQKIGVQPDDIQKTGIWGQPFKADFHIPTTLLQEIWTRKEVLSRMQPLPHAIKLCSRLAEAGRLSSYITRRNPSVSKFTWASLLAHGFPYAPIHHVGGLSCEAGRDLCKTVFAKRYGSQILIDDNVDEAQRALDNSFLVIMPNQPWNQAWAPMPANDRLHRTDDHLQTIALLGLPTKPS